MKVKNNAPIVASDLGTRAFRIGSSPVMQPVRRLTMSLKHSPLADTQLARPYAIDF
jgi:hypothetical protein